VNALALGHFDFADDWIEETPQHHLDESAGLLFLRAQVRLAGTVPPDQRQSVLNGLPRDLGMITFAQTAAAVGKRADSLADLKAVQPRIAELDLPHVSGFIAELILWLDITDPATRETGMATLAADLRNPTLVIERVRLAISFGVEFDREGLWEELQTRRLAGGWTGQEASTAILLQLASNDYAGVAAFIQENRKELQRARSMSAEELTGIEIEALARSGAVAKARARFDETREGLPAQMALMLEKVLAERDGQGDEVELARQTYEQNPGTDELRLYCGALARRGDYATLAERGADLARRTLNVEDLLRAFKVLQRLGRWRTALELLDELQVVSPQDERVRLAKAEALFHIGEVNRARAILDRYFSQSADPGVVQLDLVVSIESGDWGHIQGIIDRVKGAPDKFTAIQLTRLARVARHAGSSYARDLMGAALKRAGDDANIYIAAYALAVDAGEEGEESFEWLRKADELSGEDGPLQRKSLKDIADMAPAWREREERVRNEVQAGNAPLFIAARALNVTVTQAALGRALANAASTDATRRSPILAFDGSRQAADLVKAGTLALDASALLTLALLGLVPKVLDAFPKVVIGAGTLSLLFEERERIRFHQPSRIAKARRLKELIARGAIQVIEPPSDLPRGLVDEVGRDLAGLLVKAREMQGLVVQPGPLHKVGSFLEVEADLGDYAAEITDTRQVLALLKSRRALTGNVERYASAYIHRADGGMAGARTVTATTPLFLDDLAVSYLEHTGTLEPLTRTVGTVTVSKQTLEEVEGLLAHEALAEKVLARVEDLRAALEGGIRRGNVVINERAPSGEEEADDFRRSPTIALLQSVTPYDAIVVDDKALNRMANWDVPTGRARTATTLDMLDLLLKRKVLAPADSDEALRVLRVANFQVIGTTEEELLAMMASASLDGDDLVETQEMTALRENLLAVAASRALQPREEPWLRAFRFAVFRAFRTVWVEAPDSAPAKGEWLLSLLPSLADFCPLPVAPEVWVNIRNLEAAETALFFSNFPLPEAHRDAYKEWITAHIVNPLLRDDPDRFEHAVSSYKNLIRGVANGTGA
jgi:tetratricopeptide repeat protein